MRSSLGHAWRDMPERFGPWRTVYYRFRDWRNRGTFDQLLKRLHLRLNDEGLIDLQTWMIAQPLFVQPAPYQAQVKKGA